MAWRFVGHRLCPTCWREFVAFVRRFDRDRVIPEAAAVVWLILQRDLWRYWPDEFLTAERVEYHRELMQRVLPHLATPREQGRLG